LRLKRIAAAASRGKCTAVYVQRWKTSVVMAADFGWAISMDTIAVSIVMHLLPQPR
jgi:hypothetical protein